MPKNAMRINNIFTANFKIFQAKKTTMMPPIKTAHNGRLNPNIIICKTSPLETINFLSYNDFVLY